MTCEDCVHFELCNCDVHINESELQQPPIGVAPHWFVYPKRMKELCEACLRYIVYLQESKSTDKTIDSPICYYEKIVEWCDEIKALCKIEIEKEKK